MLNLSVYASPVDGAGRADICGHECVCEVCLQDFNAAGKLFFTGAWSAWACLPYWPSKTKRITDTQYPKGFRLAQLCGCYLHGRLVLRHWSPASGHRHHTQLHEQHLDGGVSDCPGGCGCHTLRKSYAPSLKPAAPSALPLGSGEYCGAGFCRCAAGIAPTSAPASEWIAALGGLFGGMFAAMAYMQVTTLSRLGEPETRVVFCFIAGLGHCRRHHHAVYRHLPFPGWSALWLLPVGVLAAIAQVCMTKAWQNQAQHTGCGESAVLGHCVRRTAEPGAVWREHSDDWLGGHCADCGAQRGCGYGPEIEKRALQALRGFPSLCGRGTTASLRGGACLLSLIWVRASFKHSAIFKHSLIAPVLGSCRAA